MELMGLEPASEFAEAARQIHESGWPPLSAGTTVSREEYQARLPQFRPCLEELGVLRSFPERYGTLRACEMVWPGASARQAAERLRPGIRAIIECRALNVTTPPALAALRRTPVGSELESLSDLVRDPGRCIRDGHVLEGTMMRCLWERMKVDYNGLLKHLLFDVVTTDRVPPEALHGRPTNLATLAAWWHLNRNPRRVCITSVAPYGYRFWCEAQKHFPECSWELLAPVPEKPNVVGAISEVGKIVYNLAKSMA